MTHVKSTIERYKKDIVMYQAVCEYRRVLRSLEYNPNIAQLSSEVKRNVLKRNKIFQHFHNFPEQFQHLRAA